MPAQLYVWKAPLPADVDDAERLIREDAFEPSDDVTWFSREMTGDAPPVWNPDRPATRSHPDRVVMVPLEVASETELRELLGEVYGLATKYDLLVYDPIRGVVNRPQAELAEYASATFWPRGAIRAFVAGAGGALLAVAAWLLGVPILSGIAIAIGAFLAVMAIWTFVHEGRIALARRSGKGGPEARR